MVAGSTPVTPVSEPYALAKSPRTLEASLTPCAPAAAFPALAGNGLKPSFDVMT